MIIRAIRDIGERVKHRLGDTSELADLIQAPTKTKNAQIFTIIFKQANDELVYDGIEVRDFKESELARYLYRRGSSRGTDTLPTSVITEPSRTLNIKFFPWFDNFLKNDKRLKDELGLDDAEMAFVNSLATAARAAKDQIMTDFEQKFASTSVAKDSNHLVTLVVRTRSAAGTIEEKFLGDFSAFRKILLSSGLRDYWFKYRTESRGRATCFGCDREKDVVGFTTTFPFYTMDKANFAPDLQVSDAWRLFPMCLDCIMLLENGKKYLDEFLKFSYYGYQYYLIPEFLLPPTDDLLEELFSIVENWKDEEKRKVILQAKHIDKVRNLTNDEREILEVLGEEENVIALTFLFYTQPQKSQMIAEMVIPQVLPTRIKQLYDAKRQVENLSRHDYLRYLPTSNSGKGTDPYEFTFQVLANIFKPKDDAKTKEFLGVTRHIFTKTPLTPEYVFSRVMNYVRRKMRDREGMFSWFGLLNATIKSFQALHYLDAVGVLAKSSTSNHATTEIQELEWIDVTMEEKIEEFFKNNAQFFDDEVKKACFLVGVLTGRLLQVQYADKQSMPFWNKLNNLQLDETRLKALLPKVINKLHEYDHHKYRNVQDLESLASNYLIAAGENWKLSSDMISYYFTLGLSLYKKFFPKKEAAEEEGMPTE